ncbi:hypothetical protein [Saccharopolyspora spinosa]
MPENEFVRHANGTIEEGERTEAHPCGPRRFRRNVKVVRSPGVTLAGGG